MKELRRGVVFEILTIVVACVGVLLPLADISDAARAGLWERVLEYKTQVLWMITSAMTSFAIAFVWSQLATRNTSKLARQIESLKQYGWKELDRSVQCASRDGSANGE